MANEQTTTEDLIATIMNTRKMGREVFSVVEEYTRRFGLGESSAWPFKHNSTYFCDWHFVYSGVAKIGLVARVGVSGKYYAYSLARDIVALGFDAPEAAEAKVREMHYA